MRELRKEIKDGHFHKVYLLTGDEEYLLIQAKNLLLHAMVREDDEMNLSVFNESRLDLDGLAQEASTFPFFNDRRVMVLDHTGVIKSGKDQFLDILKNLPDTTCVIILESKVEKNLKTYKWIKKNQCVREFMKKDQSEKMLLTWIAALLARQGKRIRETDARYLLQRVGTDMYQLSNEADKLVSYTGDREEISREDIDAISTGEVTGKVFDMVSLLAAGDKAGALACYNDLVTLREPPMRILYLILRQYRILLLIKTMRADRRTDGEIAREAGIPSFAVKKNASCLGRYSRESLEACMSSCVKTEEDIKNGRIADRLGLEMLIVSLASI